MSKDNKTISIEARKRNAEADAALDQMHAYFTRQDSPRPVVSEYDAQKVA